MHDLSLIELIIVYIFLDFMLFTIDGMYQIWDKIENKRIRRISQCPFCRGIWIGVLMSWLAFLNVNNPSVIGFVIHGPMLAALSIMVFNIVILKEGLYVRK